MARNRPRLREPGPPPQDVTVAATWADWLGKFQALQVHTVREMLVVYNRYVDSLASSRDAQAVGVACQTAMSDWVACAEGMQHEWLALSRVVPADALAASGWRLRPGARSVGQDSPHEGTPDFFEQSRLGVEMLLRPWMPAPDLDHTDEFVA